jgi:hypothetical protein
MSLLIKNGEIVTASQRYSTDILCEKVVFDSGYRGTIAKSQKTSLHIAPSFLSML